MKYYLIAGEPSGDLHAAHLMTALRHADSAATFRFLGGDNMTAAGGTCVQHFKDIAYMGFVPVAMHLRTILRARQACKEDIVRTLPDVVILVDYADFNLHIAKFIKTTRRLHGRRPAVYFYISPKLWAWKEGRIRLFKRYVDELFCILPFEKDFFETKHHYPVHYVGNPTAEEVRQFCAAYHGTHAAFAARHHLDSRPIIALLPGSRRQEIKDSLPMMARIAEAFPDYQFVIAALAAVDSTVYDKALRGHTPPRVVDATYELLTHSTAAIVTSGTATLETACLGIPQVVIYKTILPHIARIVWDHCFGVKYISLVNLIADEEVVEEMFAEKFTCAAIIAALTRVLPGGTRRQALLAAYAVVQQRLGTSSAPTTAAQRITAAQQP